MLLKSRPEANGGDGENSYRAPAASAWALTGTGLRRGRINANTTRKIPYAVRTPNAIDPTVAHTNITKFNKSAIYTT